MRLTIVRRLEALEGPQNTLGQLQRQRQVEAAAAELDDYLDKLIERMRRDAIAAGIDLDNVTITEAELDRQLDAADPNRRSVLAELSAELEDDVAAIERWV